MLTSASLQTSARSIASPIARQIVSATENGAPFASPSRNPTPSRAANAGIMRTEKKLTVGSRQLAVRTIVRALLLTANCLLLTAYCSLPVRAQDEPPPPPQTPNAHQRDDGIETVRIDTELVDLNVSVFNRDPKRPVGELKLQDFAVMENGAPEEISFFASAEAPFDLVLLLDLSGSSVDKLSLIRKSAIRFVEAARPADRISIITFTDMPVIVSPPTTARKDL